MGSLAPFLTELVTLEQQVSAAAAAAEASNELRVYPWRPTRLPELPAIWNWIDDGSYEIVDTARADDIVVVRATIGVKPSDILERSMSRLVVLADHFCDVVDPALNSRPVLNGTARSAKRVVMRTSFDDFNDVPVMCMDVLIRVQLPKIIGGS